MVNWTTVSVSFPDVADCNDDEMEALLRFRDGRWSAPVKAAQARFGAPSLDLDKNWAGTPIFWTCPGCNRGKAQLFRVNQAGILLARLDVHHDHLEDYIKDQLRQRFGQEWPQKIPSDTHHIETLGSTLVRRFAATIVCIDCNAADGAAKNQIAGIHPHFSFRPAEIAAFSSITPNQSHKVDAAKAERIWQNVQPELQQRLALADLLVEKICDGALTCPRTSIPLLNRGADILPLYYLNEWFGHTAPDGHKIVQQSINQILSRSLARGGTATRAESGSPKKAPKPPSEQEVHDYDGGGSPRLWSRVEASWRCPACLRSKQEILRPSQNRRRKWSGKLHEHNEYTFYQVEVGFAGEEPPEFYVDRHESILICSDCLSVSSELKQRNPKFSNQDFILQTDDIRSCIRATPNCRHVVDWNVATARAEANSLRVPRVESYWRQFHEAVQCRNTRARLLTLETGDEGRAMARLFAVYRERDPSRSSTDLIEDIEYLLSKADRLSPPSPH